MRLAAARLGRRRRLRRLLLRVVVRGRESKLLEERRLALRHVREEIGGRRPEEGRRERAEGLVADDVDCGPVRREGSEGRVVRSRWRHSTGARRFARLGRTVSVEVASDTLPAAHQLAVGPARERAIVRLGRAPVSLGLGRDDPVADELVDILATTDELRVLEDGQRLLVRPVQEGLRSGQSGRQCQPGASGERAMASKREGDRPG